MTGQQTPLVSPKTRNSVLILLAAIPAVYLLLAIQYSAITVPFWDHTELIRWIAAWREGNFHFSSLWAPHNHTRPFVYRLVMLINAVATDWDIRSEYIYLYLSIYGTFACFVWLARRLVGEANEVFAVTLLIVSLIVFSPVGHNNHWWSMMFQLDATNFFIALSFLIVFTRPEIWSGHIVAAASCWLAAFTLTNGFFAFTVIIVTFQLSAAKLMRPDRFAVFWVVNLLVASACYLPGIQMDSSPTHPSVLQLLEFSLAYLGAPLGGLLWFSYRDMFHLPLSMAANVACGCILLATGAALSLDALPRLRKRNPAAMVLFGFGGYAILSAVATGWARAAFDEFGVANGNASRYTIFGAYLMLGQVYYVGAGLAHRWWDERAHPMLARRIVFTLAGILIAAAFVSYGRAWRVYANAHDFNRQLAQAYVWGLHPVPEDRFIHPNPEAITYLKRELQLLELGPYSNRAYVKAQSPVGNFNKPVYLSARRTVKQRFLATDGGLKRLSFKFVTPNGKATKGIVTWELSEVGGPQPIARGDVDAAGARDWAIVSLQLPYVAGSKGRTYELTFSGAGEDVAALGLPLYEPVEGSGQPVVLSDDDDAQRGRLVMELTTEYAK